MSKMGAVQQNYDDVQNFLNEKREEMAEEAASLVDLSFDLCITNAIDMEILIYDYLPMEVQNKQAIKEYYEKRVSRL